MKILIFSPKYRTEICGVGDHSLKLSENLTQFNISVEIMTFSSGISEDHVHSMPRIITMCLAKIDELKPDKILIQYTPNLWAKNGRSLDFELFDFIKTIKTKKVDVITFFHEVRYPIFSDFRGIFFGPRQLCWSLRLAHLSDKLIFSCEEVKHQFKYLYNVQDSIISPVGSNISVINEPSKSKVASNVTLLIYAKRHPSKLESWNIDAIKYLILKFPHIIFSVKLIGVESDAEYSKLGGANLFLDYCGFVSEEELSIILSEGHILLSPYLDGVGTRRGGLFSGMAHSLKIISNTGKNNEYPWEDFLYLAHERSGFSEMCKLAVDDLISCNFVKNERAKIFYMDNFSWKSNIQKIISYIGVTSE